MELTRKKFLRLALFMFLGGLGIILLLAIFVVGRTWGRTVVQIDIHQNKDLIYLSTFSEPPQFAIWLENPDTKETKTVFVTHRVAIGDWEGKANVPVALPKWFLTFRGPSSAYSSGGSKSGKDLAITGATPKADMFSIRVEVKPGSKWLCWIEMNLAGDFNDAFPEFNIATLKEDEFSNGQPALLYKAEIVAEEGKTYVPELEAQATWDKGEVSVQPVNEGVTTAKNVFDDIKITVSKPKPKLIDKTKVEEL
jgi:hypothetical protein